MAKDIQVEIEQRTHGLFMQGLDDIMSSCRVPAPKHKEGFGFLMDHLDPELNYYKAGANMELTTEGLKVASEELRAAKELVQQFSNEFLEIAAVVKRRSEEHIKELRETRFAVVGEIRDTLTALREIRRFFLDKDYEQEMVRLERFVKVCRELQALRVDGTINAVCDTALRLAVEERSDHERQSP